MTGRQERNLAKTCSSLLIQVFILLIIYNELNAMILILSCTSSQVHRELLPLPPRQIQTLVSDLIYDQSIRFGRYWFSLIFRPSGKVGNKAGSCASSQLCIIRMITSWLFSEIRMLQSTSRRTSCFRIPFQTPSH